MTRGGDGRQSTYALDLQGTWRADKNNRISFLVRREGGRHNILTFRGAWDIGKNHQIIYRYEKAALIRKKRLTHALTFSGCWTIRDKARISYLLEGDTDCAFDFKSSVGIAGESYIKYEVGIALKGRPEPVRRTVILSGKWKLKKDAGILFDMEYEGGKIRSIAFGADARLTGRDTVIFKLKDDFKNRDIGITLKLSRRALEGDGEIFLRALTSKRELACYAGAVWRW
jgi:hypothetical protein